MYVNNMVNDLDMEFLMIYNQLLYKQHIINNQYVLLI